MASDGTDKPAEEPKPTPVFGSGLVGTGFAGFTGVSSTSSAAPAAAAADAGEGDDGADPEEECQAEFKPLVQLEEVETSTGEEDEECLIDLKCKLYRFDSNSNEWKERGIGQARLLKHKANQRVRLLMRQEKTLKIRANHIVMPGTKLQEHAGSDKAWVWSTVDFSEGEQKVELFCIRFGTAEKAQDFKAKYEEAEALNAAALGGAPTATATKGDAEADAEADKLAEEIEAKAAVKEEEAEEEPVAA
ncbi:putative Ran-binding protein 1 c [Monoraphidium neglectum]|uniref:Putative Ran-binding protein 1 c n=1 Tax=Monoraphidium neglectum TaxID=145388 RepID=A0A0D2NBL6_9CHLO|nr:putative Ran-binding protein 1 c [Monoraphidium neglectum]KIZ02871.1 putative Ran-binding protein 1 c [Monoraphidium neglectum]|eukprot:XP_013901890.1 putative Ran-binding protein 1 c [Monoraphidium neglectum]